MQNRTTVSNEALGRAGMIVSLVQEQSLEATFSFRNGDTFSATIALRDGNRGEVLVHPDGSLEMDVYTNVDGATMDELAHLENAPFPTVQEWIRNGYLER